MILLTGRQREPTSGYIGASYHERSRGDRYAYKTLNFHKLAWPAASYNLMTIIAPKIAVVLAFRNAMPADEKRVTPLPVALDV